MLAQKSALFVGLFDGDSDEVAFDAPAQLSFLYSTARKADAANRSAGGFGSRRQVVASQRRDAGALAELLEQRENI